MHTGLAPTKTPVCHLWYRWGRSSTYLHILFLWWEEAQPKNLHVGSFHYHCTVAAIYVGWRFNCRFLESGLGYVGFFRKTIIIFMKYNHEIYFRSNCLGWLHVTGLSSWWISSKIQSCPVCVCVLCKCCAHVVNMLCISCAYAVNIVNMYVSTVNLTPSTWFGWHAQIEKPLARLTPTCCSTLPLDQLGQRALDHSPGKWFVGLWVSAHVFPPKGHPT